MYALLLLLVAQDRPRDVVEEVREAVRSAAMSAVDKKYAVEAAEQIKKREFFPVEDLANPWATALVKVKGGAIFKRELLAYARRNSDCRRVCRLLKKDDDATYGRVGLLRRDRLRLAVEAAEKLAAGQPLDQDEAEVLADIGVKR